MNTTSDRVSIIMPCYNSEKTIAEAIESVCKQTYENWELLIVDNKSNDNSLKVVRNFSEKDDRIELYYCEKPGAGNARNMGIINAQGRFIAFLDADDVWRSSKLTRQVEFMNEHSLGFCWSSYDVIDIKGEVLRGQYSAPEISYYDLLKKKSVIGCLTAVYDVSRLGRQLMPDIALRQDYALWLRLLRLSQQEKIPAAGLRESLALYRVHEGGMTKNKFRAAIFQWRVYRCIECFGFFESLKFFSSYILNGLKDRSFGRRAFKI